MTRFYKTEKVRVPNPQDQFTISENAFPFDATRGQQRRTEKGESHWPLPGVGDSLGTFEPKQVP